MSELIYHITTDDAWKKATSNGQYMPTEYMSDGFIHASYYHQLDNIANFIFTSQNSLLILEIDTGLLQCEIRKENVSGGKELFPHIYGALPTDAVIRTFHIERQGNKGFILPIQTGQLSTPHGNTGHSGEQPWYRQFWPWFLIALPGAVVIASFVTLYIAQTNPPDMVADNYYREGLGINQTLAEDTAATELLVSADVVFSFPTHTVTATLTWPHTPSPTTLTLKLFHPALTSNDTTIALQRQADGKFVGVLPDIEQQRWYVELRGDNGAGKTWRLKNEIHLRDHQQITLMHP